MIRFRHRNGWGLIALAAAALVSVLAATGALSTLENAGADARSRLLMREVRSDIVIVGIDAASLAALDQWPWPRRYHAKLVEELSRAAPDRVFIDIDFSSQSNALDDAVLEAALAKPRDYPLALPTFFQRSNGDDGTLSVSKPLRRFARRTENAVVNGEPGADGRTRQWRNFWTIDGARVPSIIDPRRVLMDDQDVPIDFSISPSSFAFVSYVDVLEGHVPRAMLAGKTVFVGATAVELGDMLSVPLYGSLPGIVVQALAAETVSQRAPRPLPMWASLALITIWAALAALMYGAKWPRNLAALAFSLAAIFALSLLAFCVLAPAARHCGSHARGRAAVRRGHRALAGSTDVACDFLRARHAPTRRVAQERGALVH